MHRKKLKYTILTFMIILTLFGTSAMGADIGTDYDDSTQLTVTTYGVQLNYRNITQSGTIEEGGSSILGSNQGDVDSQTNVTFNITSTDGDIGSVDYFNITAWYDNGTDNNYYDDIGGAANYKWKLEMDNTSGTPSWSLVSSHSNSEIVLNGYEKLFHNQTTQNWTVSLSFNYQVKHALPDTGDWAGPPDTINTWNVNWTAAQPTYDINTTWNNEFGIYKYVYVSASSDPTGTGQPGTTIDGDSSATLRSTVTFRTNDAFNISTQINNTLDNGGDPYASDGSHSIDISNVGVKTDWTDGGITTYTSFSSLGEKIMLNTSGPHDPYYFDNEQDFQTYWEVTIPLGQYADTYRTAITYKIEIDANL